MAFDIEPEEESTAELGGLSALAGAEIDLSQLGTNPSGVLQSIYKQQVGAQKAQERGDAERFAAARERIAAQNRGPSQSEILLALSRSMLAPMRYRGFAGFADNMVTGVSGITAGVSKARKSREDPSQRWKTATPRRPADMASPAPRRRPTSSRPPRHY